MPRCFSVLPPLDSLFDQSYHNHQRDHQKHSSITDHRLPHSSDPCIVTDGQDIPCLKSQPCNRLTAIAGGCTCALVLEQDLTVSGIDADILGILFQNLSQRIITVYGRLGIIHSRYFIQKVNFHNALCFFQCSFNRFIVHFNASFPLFSNTLSCVVYEPFYEGPFGISIFLFLFFRFYVMIFIKGEVYP